MLVLTRKAGENIHIGDYIVISVSRISGRRVRLGIEAPHGVAIRRDELLIKDRQGAIAASPHACRPIGGLTGGTFVFKEELR